MKYKVMGKIICAVLLLLVSSAMASTTWYVNGVSGSDSNNCLYPTTACKTIGHAISLAASGDTIMVAAATYTENLGIRINLTIIGSGASTTIIDGGSFGSVVRIGSSTHVTLSQLTIQNGFTSAFGGGISNRGTLMINRCTLRRNQAYAVELGGIGGGIANLGGTLTINQSTLWKNSAQRSGGGIANSNFSTYVGTVTINNSTLSGNSAGYQGGGGISNGGTLTINNSTLSGNSAGSGGGISGGAKLQNSIVANNVGGNCSGVMMSNGYNLSSDKTCKFSGPGDLNNIDPQLGPLQNNGGPTQTMALPSGSPAVDAGNPTGCTDSLGHLLKTDQRGKPRPDTEDTGGCDMGAYERQSD